MTLVYYVTHPEVQIDPNVPVPDWTLSAQGRARIVHLVAQPWFRGVRGIYSSGERKAIECADIAAVRLGLPRSIVHSLGENDRSSTGYLPSDEFEATADQFFAHPSTSVRGWETAADAQSRIVGGIGQVIAEAREKERIAIFAHGGVGALYLAMLKGVPISRAEDQPTRSGNYFAFSAETLELRHGWRSISESGPI